MSVLRYPFDRVDPVQPPDEFTMLRSTASPALVTMPTGGQAYLVTRHEQARLVLSDERFSANRNRPGAAAPVPMARDDSMMSADPPEHTRLRRLVSKAFTARRVEGLRPRIAELTTELLDAMADAGPPADLRAALAKPLPILVIAELLGVPDVDRDRLADWSTRMSGLTAYPPEQIRAARDEFRGYLGGLITVKRARPGDDLLSALIAARDEGGRLSDSELVSQALLLLFAGHESTGNQIGNGAVALLSSPSRYAALCQDPSTVDPVVEELLRYAPPGDGAQLRIAVADVRLGGVLVPAGSTVLVAIGAANRDGDVFADPDAFDPARAANQHLTFGHGIHFCLAAALARAELQIVFWALCARFPSLRLAVPAGELRWQQGMRLAGYEEIPVRW
ncbi:cytochrome P450 [Micromonospora sp. CPCC 206061]|uniref:cytochrome P450 n=1 Tax=Micromonospora sp. CPCC 206061 TaxID=3122410 RepID=UPI002FF3A0FE